MKRSFFVIFFFLQVALLMGEPVPVLRWAADTESGAPNVFYRDGDLSRLSGFEKDVIDSIAALMGRRAIFFANDWNGLIPGLQRNLYDVVVNGISPDEVREHDVAFSEPYYACPLSLVTTSHDRVIRSVLDCNGAKVGVLQNCQSDAVLRKNLQHVEILEYPNEYCAISALQNGRVSAILLDWQVAQYYVSRIPGIMITDSFGDVKYSVVLAHGNKALLDEINAAITEIKRNGTLQTIIDAWGLENEQYLKLMLSFDGTTNDGMQTQETQKTIIGNGDKMKISNILPLFFRGAGVTLFISMCAMTVAIVFGLGLSIVRVYMPKLLSAIALLVIEFLRGTPLLIQLFFMFYGLPCIGITLRPLAAGILTLGINYAAYEAENFRAGMAAVPHGQMEAARALGMNQWQSLRHVVLPQAFTFILPPLTNDFISLLKDSSLVSLITIVELTKAYTIAASSSFNFFLPGVIVACIYFLIGLPFVRLAKWAEQHLKLEKRAYSAKKF